MKGGIGRWERENGEEMLVLVVSGYLEHQDTMNNTERLQRGDVQFTSAGTGMFIYHILYFFVLVLFLCSLVLITCS
jgi:hypothetical protein